MTIEATLYYGSMYAKKSKKLIDAANDSGLNRDEILVIKPSIHKRDGNYIKSKNRIACLSKVGMNNF